MIKLLFDADIFFNVNSKVAYRSGIFWVAYNIFKKLAGDDRFDITLFSFYNKTTLFEIIENDDFLKQFKINYKFKTFIKNDKMLTTSIRNKNFDENNYDCYLQVSTDNIGNCLLNNVKNFFILHDTIPLIYPEFYNDFFKNYYTKVLNKDTYGFCVSQNTKNDFLKYFPDSLDEDKLFVMPISSSQNFYYERNKDKLKEVLKKYNVSNDKYIFSLCTLEPRKNLVFTIKCFIKFIKKHNINDLYFYLGGGHWNEFITKLDEEISDLGDYKDKIVKLGYIDDEDLNILYNHSLFFAYVSKYEGFGMPPLEAMMCGTPVITSNTSSIPEVVGNSAIKVDPKNEDECIKAMEDFYFNEELRKEYSQKGLERAKLFNWDKSYKLLSNKILEICK